MLARVAVGRWRAMAAVAVASVAAVILVGVRPAGASLSFAAVAAADGLRLAMSSPGAPGTDTPIDGGGPSAQAALASTGTSQAFASLPYPGEVAVTLPGLLAAVGVAGVPDYPFYRATDFPTAPDAELSGPGYRLTAASRERESGAAAVAGSPDPAAALFDARADVSGVGDRVQARATSTASSLQIGDLVIGKAASRAAVLVSADGKRERSADFVVTGVAISGIAIVLGPDGLTLAGSDQRLGDSSALTKLLAEHNLQLEYLAPEETPDGILSGGLRVTTSGEVPGVGKGAVKLTLGRAWASVQVGTASAVDVVSDIPGTIEAPGAVPSESPPVDGLTVRRGDTPSVLPPAIGNGRSGSDIAASAARAGDRRQSALANPAPNEPGAPEVVATVRPGERAKKAESALRSATHHRSFDGARLYPMLLLGAGLAYAAIGASTGMTRRGK